MPSRSECRSAPNIVHLLTCPFSSIVILHGLNGNPYKTFHNESTGFFWPIDLQRHLPSARIMTFGYLADFDGGSTNRLGVHQHAESLLMHLKNHRLGTQVSELILPKEACITHG